MIHPAYADTVNRRPAVMRELLRLLRLVDDGKWFARRGGIIWATWTWPKDICVAVRCSENTPPPAGSIFRNTQITIEAMTRIPEGENEVDDDALDAIDLQIQAVCYALAMAQVDNQQGGKDSLIHSIEWTGSEELSDIDLKVQGWNVTLNVEY